MSELDPEIRTKKARLLRPLTELDGCFVKNDWTGFVRKAQELIEQVEADFGVKDGSETQSKA